MQAAITSRQLRNNVIRQEVQESLEKVTNLVPHILSPGAANRTIYAVNLIRTAVQILKETRNT